jgi:outer membrane murein-binding lipoprotein Lpp
MKKLAIAVCLLAFLFIVGCQAPQDVKAQMDKQSEQIKMLEAKVTEHAAKIEQLKMDFEKHLTDFHKQASTGKTATQPQPPTRVGR